MKKIEERDFQTLGSSYRLEMFEQDQGTEFVAILKTGNRLSLESMTPEHPMTLPYPRIDYADGIARLAFEETESPIKFEHSDKEKLLEICKECYRSPKPAYF